MVGESCRAAPDCTAEGGCPRMRAKKAGPYNWSLRLIFGIFGQTLRTLWAHKLRSFLTMFGIAWGVGSLLLLVGVGEGFRAGNRRELATMGEDDMLLVHVHTLAVDGHCGKVRCERTDEG